jgi:hypothetical protein
VDVSRGETLSRLYLGDEPGIENADPAELEGADTERIFRLRAHGGVVADGRYAYYVPQQLYGQGGLPQEAGFLKKIDLAAHPPRLVRRSAERAPDLAAGVVAGDGLFFMRYQPPANFRPVALRRVRVFGAGDLAFRREVELPTADCNQLAGDDGHVYALDAQRARLAVLDATGQAVRILDGIGGSPRLILAVGAAAQGR